MARAASIGAARGPAPANFGLPDKALLDRVKATGAIVLSSATTVAEACWLEAHGADEIGRASCRERVYSNV